MKSCVARFGPLAGALLLLTACTTVQQRHVLVLLFDGVPAAEATVAAPVASAPAAGGELVAAVPDLYLAARAAPPGFRHKPYAERECLACHESQFSQKMRGTVTEICKSCHQAVFAPRPFAHAPVTADSCLECHHPHESLQPALLTQPGRQLCFECHAEKRVLATPAHARIGEDACHACHDPHGGQDKHLLKNRRPDGALARLAPVPAQ